MADTGTLFVPVRLFQEQTQVGEGLGVARRQLDGLAVALCRLGGPPGRRQQQAQVAVGGGGTRVQGDGPAEMGFRRFALTQGGCADPGNQECRQTRRPA